MCGRSEVRFVNDSARMRGRNSIWRALEKYYYYAPTVIVIFLYKDHYAANPAESLTVKIIDATNFRLVTRVLPVLAGLAEGNLILINSKRARID